MNISRKNLNKALMIYIFFLVSRCTFSTSHLVQLFGMELGRARKLVAKASVPFRQELISCSKPLQGNSGKNPESRINIG